MTKKLIAVALLLIAGLVGCAGHQNTADGGDIGYVAPASIYSVMDSTALVYTDVSAGSPLNDNPWRWLGFLLHPIGPTRFRTALRTTVWVYERRCDARQPTTAFLAILIDHLSPESARFRPTKAGVVVSPLANPAALSVFSCSCT